MLSLLSPSGSVSGRAGQRGSWWRSLVYEHVGSAHPRVTFLILSPSGRGGAAGAEAGRRRRRRGVHSRSRVAHDGVAAL